MHQSNIAQLKKNVAPFEKTDTKSSIRQMINTIVPLLFFGTVPISACQSRTG